MTTQPDRPAPLDPLDESDDAEGSKVDDPEARRDQKDAKVGDEQPGRGDPDELPPPVPGP